MFIKKSENFKYLGCKISKWK